MTEQNKEISLKALEWVLDIEPVAIFASINEDRNKYPHLSNRELAEKAFSKARLQATTAGFVTGLPSNIFMALPAATSDVAITLKTEVAAVAKVALIYDENFFKDEDAKWELLIPVFGINAGSQVARELGIRGGMGLTRATIKKYLTKEMLKQFKRIMLKYFGMKVTQKGLITKTIPIVGGIIGGTWNYIEVGSIKKRTIEYFEKD